MQGQSSQAIQAAQQKPGAAKRERSEPTPRPSLVTLVRLSRCLLLLCMVLGSVLSRSSCQGPHFRCAKGEDGRPRSSSQAPSRRRAQARQDKGGSPGPRRDRRLVCAAEPVTNQHSHLTTITTSSSNPMVADCVAGEPGRKEKAASRANCPDRTSLASLADLAAVGVRRSHSFRHHGQGNALLPFGRDLGAASWWWATADTEWTRRSAAKFRPGGGGQGSTGCVFWQLAGPFSGDPLFVPRASTTQRARR